MINMMYLVLTALLAMNVSKEVLNSFQQLADSLGQSAQKFNEKNHQLGEDIIETIQNDEESDQNDYLIPLVEKVETVTDSILGIIDTMRADLFSEEVGGRDEAMPNHIKNKSETEANYRYWMIDPDGGTETDNDGRGSGKAYELHQMLDWYVNWANTFYSTYSQADSTGEVDGEVEVKEHFTPIAQDPEEIFPDKPEFAEVRGKTWEYYNFHNMPVVANLAFLEKIKTDINVIESDLLQLLRQRINNLVFKIDSLIAVDAPESKVVVAGMRFKTKLYVTVASTQMTPQFSGSGRIELQDGGQSAIMSLPANGSVVPKGKNQGTQTYTATIRVPKADGSTVTLPVNGEFTVRKPELQVEGRVVQRLYASCMNTLKIDVPALGALYNPVIKARGGTVKVSESDRRNVAVIPTGGNRMQLIVSTNTNGQTIEVGRLDYEVVPPPKPSIKFFSGNREWIPTQKVHPKAPITVRVEPDKPFMDALPRDARYQIAGLKLLRKPGLGAPTPVKTFGVSGVAQTPSISIPMATVWQNPRRGEKIFVEIVGVNRVNFANKPVRENFSQRELTQAGYIE